MAVAIYSADEESGDFTKATAATKKRCRFRARSMIRLVAPIIEKQARERWEQEVRERLEKKIEKFWEQAQLRSEPTLNQYETGKLACLEAVRDSIFDEGVDE